MTVRELRAALTRMETNSDVQVVLFKNDHIPPDLVVELLTTHRKPPEVRICRLRNQSRIATRPPSTSTPHCPACWARR
jgi:hypothetical protein